MVKYKARLLFQILTVLGGLVLVNLAYIAAFFLRFTGLPPYENFGPYIAEGPYITVAALTFLGIYGMHTNVRKTAAEIASSVFCLVFLITLSSIAVSYFFGKFAFPRTVFILAAILQLIFMYIWFIFTRHLERRAHGTKQVILIGEQEDCLDIYNRFKKDSYGLYEVKGVVTKPGCAGIGGETELKFLANFDNYAVKLDLSIEDILIICSDIDISVKKDIIYHCLEKNITLLIIPEIYEIMLAQSKVVQIGDVMLFGMGGFGLGANHRFIKRAMDILISLAGLIILGLPMLIVALIIKIDSRGPVLYRQARVGENGAVFNIFKFRTMIEDAEEATGPVLTKCNDQRVTRVGRILRAARIDEVPQLINVLKGEMSLVGPRPERPFFVEQLSQSIPDYVFRTKVKAGITGLAQVAGNYSTNPEDKLRYDLLYAKTYSPLIDVKIMFQTLKVILMKDKSV